MINKDFLKQMESINNELVRLKKRLENLENRECTSVVDSVKGSSTSYPYIQHSCVIEGVEIPKNRHLKAKYRKMIKSKTYKLEKLKIQLEYELNYIKEPEIRDIIRYKYNDGKSWIQIMFLMKYNSESVAKMKLKRFFEKNELCDKCDELR